MLPEHVAQGASGRPSYVAVLDLHHLPRVVRNHVPKAIDHDIRPAHCSANQALPLVAVSLFRLSVFHPFFILLSFIFLKKVYVPASATASAMPATFKHAIGSRQT
jgi:hypothetical protein